MLSVAPLHRTDTTRITTRYDGQARTSASADSPRYDGQGQVRLTLRDMMGKVAHTQHYAI